MEFTAVCSNICANPLRAQWRVSRRISQASKVAGPNRVNTGSEVEYPRYWNAWRRIMRRAGSVSYGIGHEVPVSIPKDWEVLHHSLHRVHGGLHGVSPSRFVNEVQADVEGSKLAVLACHPVSEGYLHDRRKAGKSWSWRHARLLEYEGYLKKRVLELHTLGFTVVVSGDMNNPDPPQWHSAQVHVAHSGLDHIWVIPAPGHRVTRHVAHSIPAALRTLGMDHPVISARVSVEPA